MQEDIIVQIMAKLKDIRKEKNITLQELAESAGVTKGMLSQVENNRTIPSLTVFLSIIKSMQIDINDFFTDFNTPQSSKVIFKKASQYHPFEKENTVGFHYHRIMSSTIEQYHVDFVLLTLMPDAQRASVQTDAFEFKYILKGTVEYTIGEEVFLMEAGDSIFFDATEPHNPRNVGNTEAQLIVLYIFNTPK
ncbi:MAG: XRE family transcriptional regulator [Ferruginibacter sp.]|jgi:transcriptional regulator with XRE-family HTH domain